MQTHRDARRTTALLPCALLLGVVLPRIAAATEAPGDAALPDTATLRSWIQEFENSPRGPFERIRWFCADGTVLPPKAYACADHGGGVQHGEWNEHALALRAGGYEIANVLASLDPQEFVGPEADLDALKQILLERFLIGWDDGWIFRGARSYRGALQIEDEEAGARRVVMAMLADPLWKDPARFYLLRETVRLMPLQSDEKSASGVRQLALVIAEKDPQFTPLRAKIHNLPDAGDAEAVREYARTKGKKALASRYEQLASDIDALYAAGGAADSLKALADRVGDPTAAEGLRQGAEALEGNQTPIQRLVTATQLLASLRELFPRLTDPETALADLQASLALETEVFAAGSAVQKSSAGLSRRDRLTLLGHTAEGLYGVGLLGSRLVSGVKSSLERVGRTPTPTVNEYRDELSYLARAPEWSGRWIAFNFEPEIVRWARIEPDVHLYSQDRLRGSPLLFYGAIVDGLVLDANRLAGIQHDLFGQRVGAGLRALNPGLTRGTLRTVQGSHQDEEIDPNGIYLLPETAAELPPVAGILTRGEGSSLSHVQLLARNLGIPNVVVGDEHLSAVESRMGTRVVLAVSPDGVVQLDEYSPRWDAVFGDEKKAEGTLVIRPDLQKLDLTATELLPLSQLRASDSGRTSGPKGANLGELKHYFGDAVPDGFVIPFGVFRKLLDQPIEAGGPSTFEWMKQQYAKIDAVTDKEKRRQMAAAFLAKLRSWIQTTDPGPEFREQLREMLDETFGEDGTYGVFVRSDTNVEDLPGFTGAGLNLTVPNLVGYDNILNAIHAVWASPFTERAYGWRQALMEDPEYVFPAVVVQRGSNNDVSGVMVTADVETGNTDWLSIAVNEGVGGAVEGQAAETLSVNVRTGEVRFTAQATAPMKATLSPSGGILKLPASGAERLLTKDELTKLASFALEVKRFPSLRDEAGNVLPADVEFGFKDEKLVLLQIRPFVESKGAQQNLYLAQLDAGLRERGQQTVTLDGTPKLPGGEVP